MDDGQSDDRSYLVAVTIELLEGLEMSRLEVGQHAVDHFAEVRMRDAEAADGVVERRPHRMLAEAALERRLHVGAPLSMAAWWRRARRSGRRNSA